MSQKQQSRAAKSTTTKGVCVAYARVSSKEQEEEGYSVPAQLRVLREYADKHGITIAKEFVEAETAKTAGRKAFEQMLKFIGETGATGILVEKTDRLYRNFSDFVKVDELAADLHFVKEGQVIRQNSHSSEKLMHSIKVCLAKNYVDNLSEEIRKGMKEKALQGVYPSHAPIGYLNVPDGLRKKIVPDPVRAPLVAMVFQLYAQGNVSIKDAAAYAYEIGLRTKKNNRVHKSSIALILQNEIYTGKLRWNSEILSALHEPIVDADVFFKVQQIMTGRTSRLGYGTVPIAYRGMIRCAKCGSHYSGEVKKGKYVYYHCAGRQSGCASGYVKEEVFTDGFISILDSIRIPDPIMADLKTAMIKTSQEEERYAVEQRAQLERSVHVAKNRLATLYEDKVDGVISIETYERLRFKYEADLAEAKSAQISLDRAGSAWREDGVRILELAVSASDRFKQANSGNKKELLQKIYSNCEFDGEKLVLDLREPFNLILKCVSQTNALQGSQGDKMANSVDWWAQLDSN